VSFKPVQINGRSRLGTEFAYSVVYREQKRPEIRFMINGAWTKKARWKNGDILRLEVDAAAKLARFVVVLKAGVNAKPVDMTSTTGRARFVLSYTGEMPGYFICPPPKETQELKVIEAGSEGVIFELP
jgi:hypothetical protein